MINLRRNALCSVCSGRSEVYFQDDKLIIDRATCSLITSKCLPFFELVVKFFTGIEKIVDKVMNHYSEEQKRIWTELRAIKLITDKIKSLRLHGFINLYLDAAAGSPQSIGVQKVFCENFVNIVRKPFIERLAALLNYEATFFETLNTRLANKAGQKPRQKAPQKPTRLLFAQPASNFELCSQLLDRAANNSPHLNPPTINAVDNLFSTDVTVESAVQANIGSSFTSYLGAIGSGFNEASTKVASILLNLTHHFP